MPEPHNPQCTQPHTKIGPAKGKNLWYDEMKSRKTFELAQELLSNELLTRSGGDEVGPVYMGIKPILYSNFKV